MDVASMKANAGLINFPLSKKVDLIFFSKTS
jgi:hypothetical protein